MALFNYECDEVKRIIKEVSPNYPQLTTYEKEWLYFHKYGYIPGTPVELEYETVSVNPTGSVSNAIPFQYKSAILKGSTKYRDIDTGDILDTFDETKNLELVSVKMPVLTTTGKNLYSANEDDYLDKYTMDSKGQLVPTTANRMAINKYIPVKPNTTYYFSINFTNSNMMAIYGYSEENESSFTAMIINPKINDVKFKTGSNDNFIRIRYNLPKTTMINYQIQIEEGSVATSYEPYKSNILTVNEDIELRKASGVYDELDLLTGELKQCIGEIVLDGSENWSGSTVDSSGTFMRFNTFVPDAYFNEQSSTFLCDRFIRMPHVNWNKPIECIHSKDKSIYINIPTSKLESNDVSGFKKWLSSNPVNVYYRLSTPLVKTVATQKINKPYEGTNHYKLTSNIPCEAILEVPVVSTGKQTLEEINN